MSNLVNMFVTVVNMSITASMMAIALIAMRPLLTRLSRAASYTLWLVVLLRMLCPVSFTSGVSLLGLLGKSNDYSTPLVVMEQEVVTAASTMQWAAPTPKAVSPLLAALATAWLCGVVVLLGYYLVSLLRLRSRTATATRIGERIYLCDSTKSPFVFGLFRPAIYLPREFEKESLQLVLLHEKAHIKRLDHIVKIIAFTVVCVHWFNPFAWISVLLMCRDMEMSCDEHVLARLGADVRKSYSLLLLDIASGSGTVGLGIASFGETDVKRRIKNVLNYKHPAVRRTVVGVVVVAAVLLLLISNPLTGPVVGNVTPSQPQPSSITVMPPAGDRLPESSAADSAEPESLPSVDLPEPTLEPTREPAPDKIIPDDTPLPIASSETVAVPSSEELQEISFVWPVNGGYLIAGKNAYRGHTGMDIAAPKDTVIFAALDGVVSYAVDYTNGAYGKRVDIDHGGGWLSRYAQCSEVLVAEGDTVKQGQLIAKVGKTGNASGNHLHFEIRYNGEYLNPADYIGTKAPEEDDDTMKLTY